jgi:hypothetical protein
MVYLADAVVRERRFGLWPERLQPTRSDFAKAIIAASVYE